MTMQDTTGAGPAQVDELSKRLRATMPQYLRGVLSSDDVEADLNEAADALETLARQLSEARTERDAAREHAVLARLREKTAEDARIHAVDTAEALQVITEQQADSIAKLERDVQRWQEAHVLAVEQREDRAYERGWNPRGREVERLTAELASTRKALETAMGHFGDDMADAFIEFVQSREQPVAEPPPSMDMFGDDEWRFSK